MIIAHFKNLFNNSIEDWLKLKADYIVDEKEIQGFGDSLDVIIIGAKYGRGTRSTSYGSFLCGMRTEEGVGKSIVTTNKRYNDL